MDLYIDTANLDEIRQAHDLGVLDGVTTNPTLIAKEGVDYGRRLAEICEVVRGPVSAEVIATESGAMISEGRERIPGSLRSATAAAQEKIRNITRRRGGESAVEGEWRERLDPNPMTPGGNGQRS